ncbi:hypothetical protein XENTR_v10000812 [Xenopus tropicalis]|nr:hypothetical protein XENTR_v10000812 [Xenopus tropicalis]
MNRDMISIFKENRQLHCQGMTLFPKGPILHCTATRKFLDQVTQAATQLSVFLTVLGLQISDSCNTKKWGFLEKNVHCRKLNHYTSNNSQNICLSLCISKPCI